MRPPVHRPALLDTPLAARTAPLALAREWGRWAGYAAARVYTEVNRKLNRFVETGFREFCQNTQGFP